MVRGRPVFEKIMRARPPCRREIIYFISWSFATFLLDENSARGHNLLRKARLCIDLFRNRRSASDGREVKRREEYRRDRRHRPSWTRTRSEKGVVGFKVFGIPLAAVCPVLLVSLFYRFIPESHSASSFTSGRLIIRSRGRWLLLLSSNLFARGSNSSGGGLRSSGHRAWCFNILHAHASQETPEIRLVFNPRLQR